MAAATTGLNLLSPCDVFALACELRTELHAVEDRQAKAKDYAEQLARRRNDLQEVLQVFETIEDKEKQTTKELHEELIKLGREEFGPSWSWKLDLAAAPVDDIVPAQEPPCTESPPRPASRTQRGTAVQFFFNSSRVRQRKQVTIAPVPRAKTRQVTDENAPLIVRTTSSLGKVKARAMKRLLSDKVKRKASAEIKRKVSLEIKAVPRKTRRIPKSVDAPRLIRRKPVPQITILVNSAPTAAVDGNMRGLGYGSLQNAQVV